MSEHYSQSSPKNKTLKIPHPKPKNIRIDNNNNINAKIIQLNVLSQSKKVNKVNKVNKGNNSVVIKNQNCLSEIENNIFDSLINVKNIDCNEGNYIYDNKERNSIQKKLEKKKKEMEDVKENINKLNQKMINIKNNLEKLETNKSLIENQLIILISNREALEEMYNTEISFIKNGETLNSKDNNPDYNCEINVSKEEIKKLNINKFLIQIITLIKTINDKEEENFSNNSFFDSLSEAIKQIYTNFIDNEIDKINDNKKQISILISKLGEVVLNKFDIKCPLNVIISLIHYLIKFNFIDEQIIKLENFTETEYNMQKDKINQEMIELTMALIFYEKQKQEILSMTSKLQDEINKTRILSDNNHLINKNYTLDIYERDNEDWNPEYFTSNQEINNNIKAKKILINKDNKNKNIIRIKNLTEVNLTRDEINEVKISGEDLNVLENQKKKNKIYENYLNNGLYLNGNKKKEVQRNKTTFNSESEFDKETNLNHNYNFNTNLLDIKPIKRKFDNNKKNFLVLRSIFKLNKSKRKKYNSNTNLQELLTNTKNIKNDIRFPQTNLISNNHKNKNNILNNKKIISNITIKRNLNELNLNHLVKNKLNDNKAKIINNESFSSNHKNRYMNHNRILTFKKSFCRTNSNSFQKEKNKSNNSSNKNIRNTIRNSNLILNINNNINFGTNVSNRKIKNISNLLTDNSNDININLNNLYQIDDKITEKLLKCKKFTKTRANSKEKINYLNIKLKDSKQKKIESFCYFKFFQKNNNTKKFNPLNVFSLNPEYFDYYESYISLDFTSGCLKISPKVSLDKVKFLPLKNKNIFITNKLDKTFYIDIKLKDIISVYLEKYAQDIIQIQNIVKKYDIKGNNNYSINKIINKRNIKEINLGQNEKIKAILCNFFPFSLNIKNNVNVDIIFINLEQFNNWLGILSSIAQNNIKFSTMGQLSNINK